MWLYYERAKGFDENVFVALTGMSLERAAGILAFYLLDSSDFLKTRALPESQSRQSIVLKFHRARRTLIYEKNPFLRPFLEKRRLRTRRPFFDTCFVRFESSACGLRISFAAIGPNGVRVSYTADMDKDGATIEFDNLLASKQGVGLGDFIWLGRLMFTAKAGIKEIYAATGAVGSYHLARFFEPVTTFGLQKDALDGLSEDQLEIVAGLFRGKKLGAIARMRTDIELGDYVKSPHRVAGDGFTMGRSNTVPFGLMALHGSMWHGIIDLTNPQHRLRVAMHFRRKGFHPVEPDFFIPQTRPERPSASPAPEVPLRLLSPPRENFTL